MSAARPITIIGGGLAGLALGLRLRQLGVPCVVWEAHTYPRHRVCGEFLSGRGVGVIEDLGLRAAFERSGAHFASRVAFFTEERCATRAVLPEPALCFSRHAMDALVASAFVGCGGTLESGRRFPGDPVGEGVVRAAGRRPMTRERGWRWTGLKAHAHRATPSADLEMHFLRDAYIGLCTVEAGRINVCGLFRSREPARDLASTWRERLRGPAGSPLREALKDAEFEEDSFTAVAGLGLRPCRASEHPDCCVGDALGMIPPVTGNGMSIALESAMLASRPLAGWSRGASTWEEARREIARACDAAFARRLRWAAWVQWAAMEPSMRAPLAAAFTVLPILWRLLFRMTR